MIELKKQVELITCRTHIIYTHFMSVLKISCYLSIGSIVSCQLLQLILWIMG